ncbi:long-chain fatty acid-CoA ligase [Clarireedia jacksonii]
MSPNTTTLQPRMSRKPPFTAEVQGIPAVDGESIPRRNVRHPQLLSSPQPGIATVFDIVKHSSRQYGDARALGSRKLIQKHKEIKKVKKVVDGQPKEVDKEWTYFEMSHYEYISFKEYEVTVLSIGAGFRDIGMTKDNRVHLFAATSAHWLSIAHGAMSQSMPIVTAYDTLGVEGLRHSLEQTKATAIFIEPRLLTTLLNSLGEMKHVKFVIYNTDCDSELPQSKIDELKQSHGHLNLLSYDELVSRGKANTSPAVPPGPEDLCCIMYTSGSSGTPKGVELKHRNVVAAIAGADSIVGDYLGPNDTLLAYLPLAHIFEFVFENACLYWGSLMGYGNPKTLSEASMRNCKGDILELRPTLLIGVPAVWETVKKGIEANVHKSGPIVRSLFWNAFYIKRFLLSMGLPGSGILDAIVFNKVKQATGGRLRFCLNGAAPISKQTQEFISLAITPMVNGYGSTETAA